MFLVELVLQGVRGIRELARLRFQSGFNFVIAGNESGKTTAIDTMQRLLFPGSQAGLMEALISRHTPDASRAALVLCSDDGVYYRIIQDFSKRAVNLSKYNAAGKDFSLLHKDWDNAVQFMAGLTTGISEGDFAKVFIFQREHYANKPGASFPEHTPIPHMATGKPAAPSGGKAAASQARLGELREALRRAEEAADAEYREQSAALALDELRKKLTLLDEVELNIGEIESTLAELKACETLPEDFSSLIDAHEQRQGLKQAEVNDLNMEIDKLKKQLAAIPTANLLTDKLFIAGLALGVLSIIAAGSGLITGEMAYYVMGGGLPLALGLIATGQYNISRKNAQRKAVMDDTKALEKERAEIERRFEQEGASIKAWIKATGSSTPAELRDKADKYRYSLTLRDDMSEQKRRILGDLTPELLREQYEKQQQEALELGKAAQAVAQYNVDTYSLKQDIDRIEAETAPEASWDFSADVREAPADFVSPAAGGGQVEFQAELRIASRIGGIELETLIPAVEAAAQRNLSAITNNRYVRIEVGQDGGPPIVHARDDSVVNFSELSHGTRDLIYFCLRTGLVEALVGKRRLPFLLDDPLAGFDPARQKAACQILRALGAKTQVILFSSNPALRTEGDVVAELK